MKNIIRTFFLFMIIFCLPVNANTILNSQRILTQLGFNPGPIDGAFGAKTKGALNAFYTSIGKSYDGLLDSNELVELQKALDVSGLKNTCNSSVQTKKIEGISKKHLNTDFNSYFSEPIITDLPRYKKKTDGALIPKLTRGFGNAEVKLIADFNNDNLDDIMIENYNTNMPPIFLISKGNGEFDVINNLPKNASRRHIRKAVAADFNNDGYLDIAGFTTGDGDKALGWPRGEQDILLINEGGKTFRNVKIPEWYRNDWNHGGSAADIDGDGLVDIIPVSEEQGRRTGPLKNFGNDLFKKGKTPYSRLITKEVSSSVMAGDLNNDGHVDLVFSIQKAPNASAGFKTKDLEAETIQVIYGDGDFNFKDNESISFGHHWLTPDEVKQNIKNQKKFKTANNPDSITPTMGYKFQASISNVELIDINRDGLLDIIAGYIFSGGSLQMSSGFKIYVNQGNCFDDQTQIYFPNQRINRDTNPGSQTAYIHRFYFEDISGDKLPDLILQTDGYMDFLSSKEPFHPNVFINNGSDIYLPLLKRNGPRLNFERYKPDWEGAERQRLEETLENHFHSVGDFDGDNRADFLFIKKSIYSSKLHIMLQRNPKEIQAEREKFISLRKKISGEYNIKFVLNSFDPREIATGRLLITPDTISTKISYVDKTYSESGLNSISAEITNGNIFNVKTDGLTVNKFGECLTMEGEFKESASFKNIVNERGPNDRDDCRVKEKLWPISLKILDKIDHDAIKKVNQNRLKENAKKLRDKAKIFAADTSKQNSISLNEKLTGKLLHKTLPVNFTNVSANVSKREGNYQQVSIDLKGLSVGNKKYNNFYFNLMIDYASKDSPRGQTELMRIQISGDGMLPEDALPELKKCKNISWKNSSEGIKIMYLIGNEAEINPCLLEKMHPDKRNFLGSIANALPNILKEGLYKNTKDLENILYLYFDAKEKEI
jgi:hypothetical protein